MKKPDVVSGILDETLVGAAEPGEEVQLNVRVRKTTRDRLALLAELEEMSLAVFVRRMLRREINRSLHTQGAEFEVAEGNVPVSVGVQFELPELDGAELNKILKSIETTFEKLVLAKGGMGVDVKAYPPEKTKMVVGFDPARVPGASLTVTDNPNLFLSAEQFAELKKAITENDRDALSRIFNPAPPPITFFPTTKAAITSGSFPAALIHGVEFHVSSVSFSAMRSLGSAEYLLRLHQAQDHVWTSSAPGVPGSALVGKIVQIDDLRLQVIDEDWHFRMGSGPRSTTIELTLREVGP